MTDVYRRPRKRPTPKKKDKRCGQCRHPLSGRPPGTASTCGTCLGNQKHCSRVRIRKGLCSSCGEPREANRVKLTRCGKCAQKSKDRCRERRASGLCVGCGAEIDSASPTRCRRCWLSGVAASTFGSVRYVGVLAQLWDEQRGRCALTHVILTPGRGASVDHIVPLCKGGTHDKSNLRWVQWMVNKAKNKYSDAEFILMCRQVADLSRGVTNTELERLPAPSEVEEGADDAELSLLLD